MRRVLETAACCLLGVGLVVVLAMADARTTPDAEFSKLYEFTRQQAYSRFKDSDARVPARDPNELEFDGQPQRPGLPPTTPGRGSPTSPPSRGMAPNAASPPQAKQLPQPQGGMRMPAAPMPAGPSPHEATHDHNSPSMATANNLAAAGRLDEAVAAFRRELQDHPGCTLVHHRLADVLAQKGDKDAALTEYAEVLKHDAGYYCVHLHIGDILIAQGQDARAEEEFNKAIAGYGAQIRDGGPQATIGRYYLADFYLKHRRSLDEAVRLAEEAAASTPPQFSYYLLLSRCYEAVGRKTEALTAIDRAIELNPQQAEVFRTYRDRLAASSGPPPGTGREPGKDR